MLFVMPAVTTRFLDLSRAPRLAPMCPPPCGTRLFMRAGRSHDRRKNQLPAMHARSLCESTPFAKSVTIPRVATRSHEEPYHAHWQYLSCRSRLTDAFSNWVLGRQSQTL